MLTDLDTIKECRQTGRTRTTTKKLLEKAYYEQMTNEIDISKVLIEGDYATIMGEKYKRIEEPKSPAEEAFKRVYGYYPVTYHGSWSAFQDGYNASQKDYKVEEPEELKTLYQMFYENDWNVRSCEVFCDIVKEWMSQYTCDYVMCEEYLKGYEYCLTVLEENLKND